MPCMTSFLQHGETETRGRSLALRPEGMCEMFCCVKFTCFNFPTVGLHPSFTSSWRKDICCSSTSHLRPAASCWDSRLHRSDLMKRGGTEGRRLTAIVCTSSGLQETGWDWIMADLSCQRNPSGSGPFRGRNKPPTIIWLTPQSVHRHYLPLSLPF